MRNGQLDQIDRHMIALLQADAREPLASLSRKLGLSRNAAQERLRRLTREGVITGFTVRLGQPVSSQGIKAYMLLYLGGAHCERVLPFIERMPEVKVSQSLGGEIDMMLYVEADDLDTVNRVRDDLERVSGVKKVTTALVLVDRFDRR